MGLHVKATNLAQQAGFFEPQRQHNWNIEITGLGTGADADIISLSLRAGFVPQVSNEEVTIPYGNEYVYVAGKAVFAAGAIQVMDWIDRRTAAILYNWRLQVYNPVTGRIGLASQYKKHCFITLFGPNQDEIGGVVADPKFEREWEIIGAWPQTVNFASNGLDMGSSGQVMIEMALRYDKAFATQIESAGSGGNILNQIISNPLSVVGL